jgi:signal peptidase II
LPCARREFFELNRRAALGAILAATAAVDQLVKVAARALLAGRPPIELLGGVVRVSLVENVGAFLSLGEHMPAPVRFAVFVVLVGVGLVAAIVWLLRGAGSRPFPQSAGLALVLGGGLGNLIDRLARGRVADFLQLRAGSLHTGVFNLGDMAIVAGVLIWASAGRRMGSKEEESC